MKILVTGCAGFIGFHLSRTLIAQGHLVVGADNLNHYYDVKLKLDRLKELGIDAYEIAMGKSQIKSIFSDFLFVKLDIADGPSLSALFKKENFDLVYHMAAQAGVRYSIENPQSYVESNLVGYANLLEACRHTQVKHLIYASSSSVYGNNERIPFSTSDNVDHPISFYAATKKCNELMAHAYSYLYGLPTTGVRFFTVYGPWGRPDMAAMLFAKAILDGQPIGVFNEGNMSRDFTYIDDIIGGLIKIMNRHELPLHKQYYNSINSQYKIYNIGNHKPVNLLRFIEIMEEALGQKAKKKMMPLQAGDVENTYADIEDLILDYNYLPDTSLEEGIGKFVKWYLQYYHNK